MKKNAGSFDTHLLSYFNLANVFPLTVFNITSILLVSNIRFGSINMSNSYQNETMDWKVMC